MFRRHGPILRTVCAASITFAALLALRFDELRLAPTPALAMWFVAGILYTNLFEYWVHRVPMHRGLPLLRHVRRNHIQHHRIFHGGNFRTRNPSDLAHISGRFWIVPVLLAVHYALATAVLPIEAALAFLSACFLHYLAFEISHWLTHLEDNRVDRLLSRIPVVASIRANQIEHHRIHHQTPIGEFNFNPPYLGDALVRPLARCFGEPGRSPEGEGRPAILYGAALILGVVALGILAITQRSGSETPVPRAKS
jgi:Fatty acid hydroxylase superfamily